MNSIKLLLVFCLLANNIQAQDGLKIRKVSLYGYANHLSLNTYDLASGTALPLKEAGYNPKKMHFGYLYGNTNKATLLTPASKLYTSFTPDITNMINSWGKDKNDGVFINLGNDLEAIRAYNNVETGADIEKLYFEKLEQISAITGYNRNINGPGDKLSDVKGGDIIIFKSEVLEPYYLIKVVKLLTGHSGEITLEIKGMQINKKSKKKKNE